MFTREPEDESKDSPQNHVERAIDSTPEKRLLSKSVYLGMTNDYLVRKALKKLSRTLRSLKLCE